LGIKKREVSRGGGGGKKFWNPPQGGPKIGHPKGVKFGVIKVESQKGTSQTGNGDVGAGKGVLGQEEEGEIPPGQKIQGKNPLGGGKQSHKGGKNQVGGGTGLQQRNLSGKLNRNGGCIVR